VDGLANSTALIQVATVEITKLGGAMSAPVRYIDRTRDYYLGQGYDKPYEWAHHDDAPFTPLTKPLSDSRVAIVSTSDIAVRKPDGDRDRDNEFAVGNVYSLPSDTACDDP
jgi:D-proline reductase (dithiol) PrdB